MPKPNKDLAESQQIAVRKISHKTLTFDMYILYPDMANVQLVDPPTPAPNAFLCYQCLRQPDNAECEFNDKESCDDSQQVK